MKTARLLLHTFYIAVIFLLSPPLKNAFIITNKYPSISYRKQQQQHSILASSNNNNRDEYIPSKRPKPPGGDMAYIRENINRQGSIYKKIKAAGGLECVNDVYARDPNQDTFWFIGKVARCTGTVSLNECISRQFNLLEEHATRIRPIELGRSYGTLELWVAPGDTELRMSQNDPSIVLTKMKRYVDNCEDVPFDQVGYVAEVVTNEGVGFCVVRREDGTVPPYLMGEG